MSIIKQLILSVDIINAIDTLLININQVIVYNNDQNSVNLSNLLIFIIRKFQQVLI